MRTDPGPGALVVSDDAGARDASGFTCPFCDAGSFAFFFCEGMRVARLVAPTWVAMDRLSTLRPTSGFPSLSSATLWPSSSSTEICSWSLVSTRATSSGFACSAIFSVVTVMIGARAGSVGESTRGTVRGAGCG